MPGHLQKWLQSHFEGLLDTQLSYPNDPILLFLKWNKFRENEVLELGCFIEKDTDLSLQ